jgi:hypothetical protein
MSHHIESWDEGIYGTSAVLSVVYSQIMMGRKRGRRRKKEEEEKKKKKNCFIRV